MNCKTMTYEIQVTKKRTELVHVEAESIDEALNKAQNGEGKATNEAETSVSATGRPLKASQP